MKIEDIKDKDLRELARKRQLDSQWSDSDVLANAFGWEESPEGVEFWKSVCRGETKVLTPSKELETVAELSLEETNILISKELDKFKGELIQKNKDYNNSLHRPNIFDQEPIEGLKARMSDKLNRILSKGLDDKTEDSMRDLFGYYIHYCIMRK
jgi:hypothetical protein